MAKDKTYYPGIVKGLNQSNEKHHVVYDDGDVEYLYLSEEKWRALARCVNHSVVVHKHLDVFQVIRKHSPYNIHEGIVRDPADPRFATRDEIEGLLKRRSYVVVAKDEIPPDATVLKSRVQNSIKTNQNGSEKLKTQLGFGAIVINKKNLSYQVDQNDYLAKLKPASLFCSSKQFARLRGQIEYVASNTRLDVAYNHAILTQVKSDSIEKLDVELLNSTLQMLQQKSFDI